jgi:hypothetical protein
MHPRVCLHRGALLTKTHFLRRSMAIVLIWQCIRYSYIYIYTFVTITTVDTGIDRLPCGLC